MSDRIAVMYLGKIVEIAEKDDLLKSPLHPYTKSLFKAIPVPNPDYKMDEFVLEGEIASAVNPPEGCPFNPRCRYCENTCCELPPVMKEIYAGHWVACHFPR